MLRQLSMFSHINKAGAKSNSNEGEMNDAYILEALRPQKQNLSQQGIFIGSARCQY